MTMGDRIHILRKDKGLTLEDIGRAAGVAKSTVRKWESGSITSIRTDKVQKVAAALGTTLEYLLNGVEDSGTLYKNMEPLPQTRPVPVIGNIACGTPILAEENVESRPTSRFAVTATAWSTPISSMAILFSSANNPTWKTEKLLRW